MNNNLSTVIKAIVVAVLLELLLLRTFLRMGPFLPAADQLQPVFQAIQLAGIASLNLAMLLGLGVVVWLAVLAIRERTLLGLATGITLLVTIAFLAALVLAPAPGGAALITLSAVVACALVLVYLSSPMKTAPRLVLGLTLASYLVVYYHYLAQPVATLGAVLPFAVEAFFASETLAVLTALATPALAWRWNRGAAIGAGLVAVLLLAARVGRPWLIATIAMWNFAFSMFLPAFVYAAAAGAVTYALIGLWRNPASRNIAAALTLIVLAGLKLDYSYFVLLSLIGFLAMAHFGQPALSESPARGNRESAALQPHLNNRLTPHVL